MHSELDKVYALRKQAQKDGEPVLRDDSFEILIKIIEEKKPEHILEIGTNIGLSGIAMLLISKNAKLTGIEIDEEKAKAAEQNYKKFGVWDRAKIFIGDASEIIPIISGKYDFIFLDGPKGHYNEYSEYLLDSLLKGGILFADNVLFRGYVGGKTKTPHRFNTVKHSMEKFLQRITQNDNLKTEIIDIEDGISITEKIK